MAIVTTTNKACTVNPLKMSQPMGAALAFLGIDRSIPLLHGSQGCTSFGVVLFVRHFRETIPMQTTAINEVAAILGGEENIEEAILTLNKKARPALIGLCSTGLTETRGDDVESVLKTFRREHPELEDLAIVYVSTPDFKGAFQDGWAKAVTCMVEQLCEKSPPSPLYQRGEKGGILQVNLLTGPHLSPADVEEIKELLEAFGLSAVILPDLSGSLDGHVPEDFSLTTLGGTRVSEILSMGSSEMTIALGESMRSAAEALEKKSGVPFVVFDRLVGLEPNDRFLDLLCRITGRAVPGRYRRQRSRLVDAMLDAHFFFGKRRVAVAAEPDLLWGLSCWLAEMGCEIPIAVTTTASPLLENIPATEVRIGDLEDLEARARGCDILLTHSHGRQASERLGIPLFRVGLPVFDRLGAAHRLTVGYRGTMALIFDVGNVLMGHMHENHPDTGMREKVA